MITNDHAHNCYKPKTTMQELRQLIETHITREAKLLEKIIYSPTWNLSIKGTAPASSDGIAIDRVVGVLQHSKLQIEELHMDEQKIHSLPLTSHSIQGKA